MAAFPSYIEIMFDGYAEEFDPEIERTEMERGPAKQAIRNTHVQQKLKATLLFKSAADVAAFEAWYFDTIQRIGYFELVHPRTKVTVSARFENASIGTLVPLTTQFRVASRQVVFEYMR